MAKLSHFYSFKYEDIMRMDADIFETYWTAITPIESQKMMIQLQCADYPNMEKSSRRKLQKRVERMSRVGEVKRKALTMEEAYHHLKKAK